MKYWVLIAVMALSSCSALSGLSMFTPSGPSLGVDTEIVTGEKEEDYGIIDKSETQTNQNAKVIHNIEERLGWPTMLLIVLLAGWAIPDPMTMGKGLLKFLSIIVPWK